ncbi:hypothetical protein [Nonomuraea insulae]|uniref:Secreted protein n=1 Tax=Nonomuraea insulae TaxID=1616787 RepID=A0ABW1DF04_9ACTN
MRGLAMLLTTLVSVVVAVSVPAAEAASVPRTGSPEPSDRWLFEPCGIVSACVVYDGPDACDQAERLEAAQPGVVRTRKCAEPDGDTVMVQWGCPADTLRQTQTPGSSPGDTCSIAWYFSS